MKKKIAYTIVKKLQDAGYETYWAGGCVRDYLLGKKPKDYDVATSATPDVLESLFHHTSSIGKDFGTIVINEKNIQTEVTTFRKETCYDDGRHPNNIEFSSAREDAIRRDFTINGMFYDPIKEELIDYVNGKDDLKKRIIRSIGDPIKRFKEDHLRMLRAIRFSHTLGFNICEDTKLAIVKLSSNIKKISIERVTQEFTLIITKSYHPGNALDDLYNYDLLQYILPEIVNLIGVQQPTNHHPEGDVFNHVKKMLNLLPSSKRNLSFSFKELAYCILLHDIAKPQTYSIEVNKKTSTKRIRFVGHEQKGAEMADKILRRLNFSNKERIRITKVIKNHMKPFLSKEMNQSTLRRMIGDPTFNLLLELHRIDGLGSKGLFDTYIYLQKMNNKYMSKPALPPKWINGSDLIKMGFKQDKRLGKIIEEVYDIQLQGLCNSKTDLKKWIKKEIPFK